MDSDEKKYVKSTVVPPKIRMSYSELKLRRDNAELIRKIERINKAYLGSRKDLL